MTPLRMPSGQRMGGGGWGLLPLGQKLLHIKIVSIFVIVPRALTYQLWPFSSATSRPCHTKNNRYVIKSIQSDFNDATDCIILGPCNLFFELAQTEQDISDPCVMNVRQAQRNHCNSEAATPENGTSNKFLAI